MAIKKRPAKDNISDTSSKAKLKRGRVVISANKQAKHSSKKQTLAKSESLAISRKRNASGSKQAGSEQTKGKRMLASKPHMSIKPNRRRTHVRGERQVILSPTKKNRFPLGKTVLSDFDLFRQDLLSKKFSWRVRVIFWQFSKMCNGRLIVEFDEGVIAEHKIRAVFGEPIAIFKRWLQTDTVKRRKRKEVPQEFSDAFEGYKAVMNEGLKSVHFPLLLAKLMELDARFLDHMQSVFLRDVGMPPSSHIGSTENQIGLEERGEYDAPDMSADLVVKDSNFFHNLVKSSDIGLGEAYMEGNWETDDIAKVIRWFIGNMDYTPGVTGGRGGKGKASKISNYGKPFNYLVHLARKNTISKAIKNIREHYDLSNAFFSLFLDKSLTYSSGLFIDETSSDVRASEAYTRRKRKPLQAKKSQSVLALPSSDIPKQRGREGERVEGVSSISKKLFSSQIAKYDRICHMLNIKPGHKVLEIGSGWGSFALYAHLVYGAEVTSITLSKAQHLFAENRRKQMGVDKKSVNFRIIDYREITGKFDRIVSIEMIEAVGWQYLKSYFAAFDRLLNEKGSFALQAILCPDRRFDKMTRNVDWIQKHIFPGSNLPSLKSIVDGIYKAGDFLMANAYDMGQAYAKTLSLWYDAFNQQLSSVRKLGFDSAFINKWNYYLKYCQAAFETRNITVMQLLFTRSNVMSGFSNMPWEAPKPNDMFSKKLAKIK